jgi:hypothetical protein
MKSAIVNLLFFTFLYRMKYTISIILGIALLIGLVFFFVGTSTQPTEEETATTTDESDEEVTVGTPAAPTSVAPATNKVIETKVQQALAAEGSMRCTWTDPSSGSEGIALIKNGKVRVETEHNDGTENILLYTSAGTYIWAPDAEEGTVVVDLNEHDDIVAYRTRSELEAFIQTNPRMNCKDSSLSDEHFSPPSSVDFTMLGS